MNNWTLHYVGRGLAWLPRLTAKLDWYYDAHPLALRLIAAGREPTELTLDIDGKRIETHYWDGVRFLPINSTPTDQVLDPRGRPKGIF